MKRAWSRKNVWERTPQWAKAGLGRVLTRVSPALLLGRRFRRALRFVQDSERWPTERVEAYQLEQLRSICALAYERTDYYRRTFDAVGFQPGDLKSLSDLHGLPFIDKGTLREHLNEMCTASPTGRGVDYTSTGGSSGTPLQFYIGADRSAIEYAYLVASWGRAGYTLDQSQAVLRGQIVARNQAGLHHMFDPLLRRHYYSNFHMTGENMRRYLDHIRTIGPCYLHVYPSSAVALACYLERSGDAMPDNIRGVLAGSENVYAEDRARVEAVMGVRVFSWYGHSEKLVFAAECEHSSVYHVAPTYGYMELLDTAGRPVTTIGKQGEIVGTGFINRIVPFIRYRTGDFAEYRGARCDACGREYPLLAEVAGRWPQGCLVAHDGAMITMTALNLHDDTLANVVAYQFYQDTPGRAELRIVPNGKLDAAARSSILKRMNARLQEQVTLSLALRDELPKTRSGKLLRVMQEIPGVVRDGEIV